MPQETYPGGAKKSSPPHPEIAASANRRIKELGGLQSDFLGRIREANQGWYSFMQTESSLASELTAKLVAARSIPEAATAWQDWASRSMQLNAEHASHLLADGQKLMETGARLLANGGFSSVRAGST
jgi:hypothetical protein